jgi:hypothetical protein
MAAGIAKIAPTRPVTASIEAAVFIIEDVEAMYRPKMVTTRK